SSRARSRLSRPLATRRTAEGVVVRGELRGRSSRAAHPWAAPRRLGRNDSLKSDKPSEGVTPSGEAKASVAAPPPPELIGCLDYARVEKGLAANSVSSYRRDLIGFLDYLGRAGHDPKSATREAIRGFF